MEEATKTGESQNFIILGVVLNKKSEVLMIRRVKKEEGRGDSVLEWAFPGGKQRHGESRTECVKRETLDETGYDVKPIQEISQRVHPEFLVTVTYYLCGLNSPEPVRKPREPHEVAEIRWVKAQKVKDLVTTDLDENVKKVLETGK